jgi:hypothetical protein
MARAPSWAMRSSSTRSAKSRKPSSRPSRGAVPECGRQAGGCPAGLGSAHRVGQVDLPADGGIVQISHHREVVGRLQGETPASRPLRAALSRAAASAVAATRPAPPGRRLGARRRWSNPARSPPNLVVSWVSSTSISSSRFLPAGVQVGAVAAEIVHGLRQEAPPLARQAAPSGVAAYALIPSTALPEGECPSGTR